MLALARTFAYGVFLVTTLLTFILAAAFVGRTNDRFGGYFDSAALLIVAGLLGLLVAVPLHFFVHLRLKTASLISSSLVELVVITILWLFYLGGAAALSNSVVTSSICEVSWCGLGRATLAFAWMSWLALSVLLGLVIFSLIMALRKDRQSWRQPTSFGAGSDGISQQKGAGHTSAQPQTSQVSMA